MRTTSAARFWPRVNKAGPVHSLLGTVCHLWTGALHRFGHGYFWYDGRTGMAHRFSWELHYGDPGELCVLHKCDVPACVNPEHLFLGTLAGNCHDRTAKHRGAFGERMGAAKLTDAAVAEMRCRYAVGDVSHLTLAKSYGVSESAVRAVLRRQTWRHVVA
jgi:hypothetical protein